MDFRIDTGWRNHPKRVKLRRRLGADGVLAIEDLWAFCAESRPNGDLSGMDAEDIAIAARYEADTPDTFVSTLVELRMLDVCDGSYRVHDYESSQPYVSTSNARKLSSQKAIHERWARAGKCKGGTEYCDERCGKQKSGTVSQENTVRITENTTGISPTSLPTYQPTNLERDLARDTPNTPVSKPNAEKSPTAGGAERLHQAFGRLLSSKDQARLAELKPTTAEIDAAIAQTKEQAGKPNAGYALSIVESSRRKPPPQEKQHNPRVGYHPGSRHEEFGEGDQVL